MPYLKEVLQPGEAVLYNKKLHWIIYRPVVILFLFVVLFGMIDSKATSIDFYKKESAALCFILFIVAVAFLVKTWIIMNTTEIVVTDKRVILKSGMMNRKTKEMNMNKVETVDVLQSILGRMLGYGDVIIRGTGTTYEHLRHVAAPLELRNAVVVR